MCFQLLSFVSAAQQVVHRVILIGDAGGLINAKNPVVDAVAKRYSLDDPNTTLVYLGDNVYERGMYDEDHPKYDEAVEIIKYQSSIGLHKQSKLIFIPGNHDWAQGRPQGYQRILNQQEWLDSLKSPNIKLLPKDGCPGPAEVVLGDKLVMFVLDTQWWLHPYDKPGISSDCECKTGDEILAKLSELAYKNRDKAIIIAMHHPFRSNGIHGGYFTLKQHVFPFTDLNKSLYIPLPILGSIYPISRSVFGNIQDLAHPRYKKMVKGVEETLKDYKQLVFVSGHDHDLQLTKEDDKTYIVSGSGYNEARVREGRNALFVNPGHGYAVLEQNDKGELNVQYYTVDEKAEDKQAFTSNVYQLKDVTQPIVTVDTLVNYPDSTVVVADSRYEKASGFKRFILGENYRKIWDLPVNTKILNLRTENGGFKILEQGGGHQTKSLRLADTAGLEWALRTIRKSPEMALPAELRETVAREVLQDQISAAMPYAPLVISTMATALKIPHAKPQIVFIPDDPFLGQYRKDFANTLCLIEQREPIMPGLTLTTPKMVKALKKDNDNSVDQKAVLRARLFDLIIGDWDRHEDQWRWAYVEKGKGKRFYPIPRDRDQAFFVNQGVLPKMVSAPWLMPMFQGFGPEIKNINGFMMGAKFFDRDFLNELEEKDWKNISEQVKAALTDSVIDAAMKQFPPEIPQETVNNIATAIKARRNVVVENALTYYKYLSHQVDISTSNNQELFDVKRLDDGKLSVSIRKISKDQQVKKEIYKREFDPSVTKEVRLFGEKGSDVFDISGTPSSPIKVRVIGGTDIDTFKVAKDLGSAGKVFIYDHSQEKNNLELESNVKLKLSGKDEGNTYVSRDFNYNKQIPFLVAGYNLDDGVLIGAGLTLVNYAYLKKPEASRQRIVLGHSLATKAYYLKYHGQFNDVIGKTGLVIDAETLGPKNTENFFGLGNETIYDSANESITFYRSRYNVFNLNPALQFKIGSKMRLDAGPAFQYFKMDEEDNEGRFISDPSLNNLNEPYLFSNKFYTGIHMDVIIDTRDHPIFPNRGIYWKTSFKSIYGLNNESSDYTQLRSDLSLFMSFNLPAKLVIADRVGGGFTGGTPSFFQHYYIGGTSLMGFRKNRFAGTSFLYNNLEFRYKLMDFRTYFFPGSLGLIGYKDIGRVWVKDENSSKWHNGIGGGIYLAPVNMLVITAIFGHSREENLPYVTLGFRF